MQTTLALFCTGAVVFLVARDLLLPEIRNVEVWFGFELRGRAALATAPLHWAVFAVGAWGAWRAQPWAVPCAAAYAFYVALSHLVWNQTSPRGGGWSAGFLQAVVLSIPGFVLLRSHLRSRARPTG